MKPIVRVDVVDLVCVLAVCALFMLGRLSESTIANVLVAVVSARIGVGVGKRAAAYELGQAPKDERDDDDDNEEEARPVVSSPPPRSSRRPSAPPPTSLLRSLAVVLMRRPAYALAAVSVVALAASCASLSTVAALPPLTHPAAAAPL